MPPPAFFNKGGQFAGLDNYKTWLLQQCPRQVAARSNARPARSASEFWASVGFTLGVTIVAVALETVIGMIMALMMHKAFKGRGVVRAAILIPWAIPTAVSAKLWQVIYAPGGVADKVLGHSIIRGRRSGRPESPSSSPTPGRRPRSWPCSSWPGCRAFPMSSTSRAKVDGASAWQRFWRITLPLVKPALAVALIFRSLDTLRMYDLPAILTGGANGTSTLSILVVKQIQSGPNSASALSTITFIFIFACAFVLVKALRGQHHAETGAKGEGGGSAMTSSVQAPTAPAGEATVEQPKRGFPWGVVGSYASIVIILVWCLAPFYYMIDHGLPGSGLRP